MPFLDADAIVSSTFVRHVELHESLPSTNDRAIELATATALETPVLVASWLQTAGRGRGTNAWWSGEGALTFSLILDTTRWEIPPQAWPRLSLTTAVAACDAIADETPPGSLAIKWPNDVLIQGAKVSGILIESPRRAANARSRLVVGVGINVNNSRRNAPSEIRNTSIAICDVAERPCDMQQILVRFLQCLERRIAQLAGGDPALPAAWKTRSSLTDRSVVVESGNATIEGTCRGIDDDGALLVDRGSHTERFFSGSIRTIAS